MTEVIPSTLDLEQLDVLSLWDFQGTYHLLWVSVVLLVVCV